MTTEPVDAAELERFRAWQASQSAGPDSFEAALKAMEGGNASFEQVVRALDEATPQSLPGSLMTAPCQNESDGVICGLPWEAHPKVVTRPGQHSYRPRANVTKAVPTDEYRRTPAEARLAVSPAPSLEDAYLTTAQAARALGIKATDVKRLIDDGGLGVEKIGTVTLVRRASVQRLVALTELESA